MKAPPDRSGVPTEGVHLRSVGLDALPTAELLHLMSEEDERAALAVRAQTERIAALVEDVVPRFRAGGRLIYVGAGTSGRLGVLDASECPPTFLVDPSRVIGIIAGGDAALRRSSESLEDDPLGASGELERLDVGRLDTVVGLTAGGTTPYPLGALHIAHARGALTALVTCGSLPEKHATTHVIRIDTGPEVLAGSTRLKAGTATKLVLNMISTALMVRLGKVHDGLMVDVSATNGKLHDRAARIVVRLVGGSREEALVLLNEAGGRVKTAVVMRSLRVSRDEAEALLEASDGSLRSALDRGTSC
ncbi:MAG: N-acetylmuramic acid 6-phosphate etherase [Phycisphaerales bacterium JB060]